MYADIINSYLTDLTLSLGLLNVYFDKFVTELLPLIDARISFLLSICRPNGQDYTNFCICIHKV